MKRAALALILTAAMGSVFAQEAAPAYPATPAVQAPVQAAAPVKSKKAPKEDRQLNGTMIGAIVLGVGVVAAVAGGGGSDSPSSP